MRKEKKEKNNKNINKIPDTVLIDLNEGNDFLIEIKKDKGILKEDKIYEIIIDLIRRSK